MKIALGIATAAVLATGCATTHLTTDNLVQVESSMMGAQQAGAAQNPQAALRLKYASDELAQAKAFDKAGDGDSAKRMLERAQADSELALALTREAQAEIAAKQSTKPSQATP